ncbi:MAG: bifunctional nuclease family protein [Bacteroidales bacterium]|jgi:bifunctional DNase/RNase|nr:bifunctional nuclease family protein [Bacteroidales bacterium]MBR4492390.1 bifunctional nuclease family protein [Bacteroidales bacterium]MBR4511429.1 bifunctional nuclease family protein [Bacteroidales bacterium]
MEKVEVRVRCIAEWGGSSMRMVLMETVDRRTVFPVIIAENEAGYLTREWMGDEGMKRPGPYDLLSEMLKGFSIELREALIYHLSEGVFMTRMVFASEQHELEVEARISDAVIMAIRSHCPVYVLPEVLEKVGVSSNVLKRMEELVTDDGKESEPASEMSLETLERRLHEAVENEDFESASTLRDQIKALKGNG